MALCPVTATERTSSKGTFEKSWIESTAPAALIDATGSNRRVSELRANSIDDMADTSRRPSRTAAFRAVGTPSVNANSSPPAWSRWW